MNDFSKINSSLEKEKKINNIYKMNKYNEVKFCDNIINKYKIKISKELSKSKSFSKYYKNNLIYDNINKKKEIPKAKSYKLDKMKKFIRLRNFSAKTKTKLFCLKNPSKSNFIQNILNEIIPKNIRRPYGIKLPNNKELPKIYTKTETNIKTNKKKLENNKNKIIFKNAPFLNKKIENITYKYNMHNIPIERYKIKNISYHGKLISNFLTPFNKFMSRDFNITNKEYIKLISNINAFNNSINSYK